MKNSKTNPRGQALVLIALAIVGLVGLTALAIDGSSVFSDRRHSQNASDTSSLAAALALTRDDTNWRTLGYDRAVSNGYDPSDGVTKIDVYLCSELPKTIDGFTLTCAGKGLPTGADPAEYVYVHIKSRVKLFFAPVVQWKEVINHTDAVAHAKKEKETSWYPGFAIVSTRMGCPSSPTQPFEVGGSSGTVITNAGILVNADCSLPKLAYDQGGSSTVDTTTGVCSVGAFDTTPGGTTPPPTNNCSPIPASTYTLPNPTCTHEGEIIEQSGHYVAYPGLYGHGYKFDSIVDVQQAGLIYLEKGIYCLYDGLNVNAGFDIRSDLDGDGYDPASEGVLLYVPQGDLTFNGHSYFDLHAVDSTMDNFPKEFVNYLIYVPPTNPNTIKVTGSNGSQFTGTILAPASFIVLNGGEDAIGLNSQIIGESVKIDGGGTLNINYQAKDNAVTTTSPSLEQTK